MAKDSMVLQTIIVPKSAADTREKAEALARARGTVDKVDETEDSYRFRQRDPDDFKEGTLRTIEMGDGVKGVVGKLKDDVEKDAWTTAYVNTLPDSAFLHVESGGSKDEERKTVPRDLRHFPYRDKDGKIDLPHLRNAIARIPQSGIADDKKEPLQAEARRLLAAETAEKSIDLRLTKAFGDGVMVCVLPPEEMAKEMVLPDGHTPEELHLTLAYFGKTGEVGSDSVLKIRKAVAGVVEKTEPMPATVSGLGRFYATAAGNGEQDALFASVDSPSLASLREAVVKACEEAGVPARKDHGFSPHITLGYVAKGAPCAVPLGSAKEFEIAKLYVAAGDEWSEHDLGKTVEKRYCVPILKADEEQRVVSGVVLVPEVVDLQGDIISEDEIRKTAYDFLSRYNMGAGPGFMHKERNRDIRLVESYVAPQDLALGSESVKKGSWVVTMKVLDDDAWSKVKSGQIRGFSIGGVTKSPEKLSEE